MSRPSRFSWLEAMAVLTAGVIVVILTVPALKRQALLRQRTESMGVAHRIMSKVATAAAAGTPVVNLVAQCPTHLPEEPKPWNHCAVDQRVAFGHYGVDLDEARVPCSYRAFWQLDSATGFLAMSCDLDNDGAFFHQEWRHDGSGWQVALPGEAATY